MLVFTKNLGAEQCFAPMHRRALRSVLGLMSVRVTIPEKRNKHHFCGALFGDGYYYAYNGNFAFGEYTHTLRLESELSDLRVGYANPCAFAFGNALGLMSVRVTIPEKRNKHHFCGAFFGDGDAYGNRTHVTAVKGPCLNRLTNAPSNMPRSLSAYGSGCRI